MSPEYGIAIELILAAVEIVALITMRAIWAAQDDTRDNPKPKGKRGE